MPVTSYRTLNGRMRGQTTSGVRTDYLTDALGSVTATVTDSAVVENTYRHKPYGERLSKTGTGVDPRFLWTGDTGSRSTGASHAEQYNRARHYGSEQATWTSVDTLWPSESAYGYVKANPTTKRDPGGMQEEEKPPKFKGNCAGGIYTDASFKTMVYDLCKKINSITYPSSAIFNINKCIKLSVMAHNRKHTPKIECQGITRNRVACLQTWCSKEGIVDCGPIFGGAAGHCPGTPWRYSYDRNNPSDTIEIDPTKKGKAYYSSTGAVGPRSVLIHELMHACGQQHNSSVAALGCPNIQACCIRKWFFPDAISSGYPVMDDCWEMV
ncbi:hypothetical protein EON81_03920 [bacterium]|nr:MAG: hypothetical protein EON81_03920 [bacterium]